MLLFRPEFYRSHLNPRKNREGSLRIGFPAGLLPA